MRFEDLLRIVGKEVCFETGILLAGDVDPGDLRRQLSRWVRAGRIHRLRRGLYALAAPFAARTPHPFSVANQMEPGTYVSCETALAFYGLIPESVQVVVSVGACRPARRVTAFGVFEFHHLRESLRYGFDTIELEPRVMARIASPEKALLDLVYLVPHGDDPDYLGALRLEHLDLLDLDLLARMAERSGSPKIQKAATIVQEIALQSRREFHDA